MFLGIEIGGTKLPLGIGGGFVIGGEIYRGVGKGAGEIGHLTVPCPTDPADLRILEAFAAGWGIEARAAYLDRVWGAFRDLDGPPFTVKALAAAARSGHENAAKLLTEAVSALAFGI